MKKAFLKDCIYFCLNLSITVNLQKIIYCESDLLSSYNTENQKFYFLYYKNKTYLYVQKYLFDVYEKKKIVTTEIFFNEITDQLSFRQQPHCLTITKLHFSEQKVDDY